MSEEIMQRLACDQEQSTQVEDKKTRIQHQYWYDNAYGTLISGLREERKTENKRNSFLVLFLEPLTLPHSKPKKAESSPNREEIAQRQGEFLKHQLEYVCGYQALEENALDQLITLKWDCIQRVADYQNYSEGTIKKTETHQRAERFLSFFLGAVPEQIAELKQLYQRELELIFHTVNDQNFLLAKVQAWCNWLIKRGVEIPGLKPQRERAGEVLLYALLTQALDAYARREDYLLTVEQVLGTEIPPTDLVEEITIPAELFTEMFVAMCQLEPFTVERGNTLLAVLQTQPKRSCQTERLLLRQAVQAALRKAQEEEDQAWEKRDREAVNAASEEKERLASLLEKIEQA